MTVQRLAAQLKAREAGAMPTGEHLVTLQQVRVVKRRKGGYAVQLISRTPAGATAREMRNLAREGEDPYNLTKGQMRSFAQFTRRLGLSREPLAAVEELHRMVGQPLTVKVRQTPHATIARHELPGDIVMGTDAGELTTDGELR